MGSAQKSLKDLLHPGDTLLVGTGTGEPLTLIEELVEASAQVPGLSVIQVMTGGIERLADIAGHRIRLMTPVPGSKTRAAIREGRAELFMLPMSGLLNGILDGSLKVSGVLMQGRALDAGHATPGLIADVMVPAWETVRFRALELNDQLPRIGLLGVDEPLDLARADRIVHSSRPPNTLHADVANDAARRIGEHVATLVPDGATIELGVGKALAGIVDALIATRRDLAMHTGIVGDAAMRLIEAGCVSRPVQGKACAVGATSMGTPEFYRWADGEARIGLVDSRRAHSANHLATLQRFTAINSAIQVDLAGNANSNVHKGKLVSGPGGAGDFTSAGAKSAASIIVMFATAPDGASTIVPNVEAVTIPPGNITHVVTEHGIAVLAGRSPAERARALAAIAAPEHREALLRAAQ